MISQYLDSLEKSLQEKMELLDSLTVMSEKQKEVVSCQEVDWDAFDKLVDDKAVIVDRLSQNDVGFEVAYDRIKDELNASKDKYKANIERMQSLIRTITDKSTSLMALEARNKDLVEKAFSNARLKINQNKVNSRVASNYYKTMSRVNFIDPQLMDKKK